jgi:hypothetical protein
LLSVALDLHPGLHPVHNLNGVYIAVVRSMDAGVHWSSPSQIAKIGTVGVSADGQP